MPPLRAPDLGRHNSQALNLIRIVLSNVVLTPFVASLIMSSSAELSQIHHSWHSFSTRLQSCTGQHVLRSESCQSRTHLWESVFSAAHCLLHLWEQKKGFQSLLQTINHRSLCGYSRGDGIQRGQNVVARIHAGGMVYCEHNVSQKAAFDSGSLFWKMRWLCSGLDKQPSEFV